VEITGMSGLDVVLLSIAEVVGDFGFRFFAQNGSLASFAQGGVGYVAVIYYLIKSFRVGNVTYVNGMWDGVSALIETAAAYFILGERLNNPLQYLGLLAIIAGIFLLHSPDNMIPNN
jgi:multidrug transporter EmrE-like cation transporter